MRSRLTTTLICSCLAIAACGVDDQNVSEPGGTTSTVQPLCNTNGDGTCGPVHPTKPPPNPYPCSSDYFVTSPAGVPMFLDPTGNYNITAHQMKQLVYSGSCDGGQIAQPRQKIAKTAMDQVDDTGWGACDDFAISTYGPTDGSEWCSEFARSVFLWSGVVKDVSRCVTDIGFCWHTEYLHDVEDVGDFRGLFSMMNPLGWIDQTGPLYWSTFQSGDYMALVGSDGGTQSHSGVAIGVSADGEWVFSVEGNAWTNPNDESAPHCVKFNKRALNKDGAFDKSQFGAVGKINKFF